MTFEELRKHYPAIKKLYYQKKQEYERGQITPRQYAIELRDIKRFLQLYEEALQKRGILNGRQAIISK